MSREYPTKPFVGVGVVVLHGQPAAEQVLLIRRGKAPLKGHWSIPGGLVELGETGAAAAAREVYEETGLCVDVGPLLTVVERIDHDDAGAVRYHYVLLEYVAYAHATTLQAADDADEAIWADPHNLAPYGMWQATTNIIALALATPRLS